MQKQSISAGQRWISNAESDLGLGTVLKVQGRELTLFFPASNEMRTYAIHSAPLTRVRLSVGDTVLDQEERRITITEVEEEAGLLTYIGILGSGEHTVLQEGQLSDRLRIDNPRQRLLTGRFDQNRWFELRRTTLQARRLVEQSPVRGLVGPRIDLLPHQLYIAHEVSRRHAPRVLLADEVGLGKTIEAGLILHSLLHRERVRRVLIITPDSLIHQWLVELQRRFNLRFAVLDEERCAAITESGQGDNPFQAEQLVLCPLGMFGERPRRRDQLVEGEWDLLIVDEAHHLAWSPTEVSPEYELIERLAEVTQAMLLLTATPEQLGKAGHFARLRLLDPDRFHDLDTFLEQEERYAPLVLAINHLLQDEQLRPDQADHLLRQVGQEDREDMRRALCEPPDPAGEHHDLRQQLVPLLLDRHGTGRILFRNTRARLEGFPERLPIPYPLGLPDDYRELLNGLQVEPEQLLMPELLVREYSTLAWQRIDPRVDFLIELLKRVSPDKVLLICGNAETAMDLADTLKLREGMAAALFHEEMSLIERDRAAAWFADAEDGARILICSEIGSEGRNFQFAHHLVLFDLPFNPDLLEQRIGRLDRIGQKHPVRIHIPYFEGTAQHTLFRWLHESLNAFGHPCPAAGEVQLRLLPMLLQAMEDPDDDDLPDLLDAGAVLREELEEAMRQGRDRLLEMNSCRFPDATELRAEAQAEDDLNRSLQTGLPRYLDRLLATFGIESEEKSLGSWIYRPGAHMPVDSFPGIPEDGVTCTFHRNIALANEDQQFLTWEHPLVREGMAMVLDDDRGITACATLSHPEIKGGRLLLEFLFVVECIAPKHLHAGRFLPPTLIRRIIDQDHQQLDDLFGEEREYRIKALEPGVAARIAKSLEARINALFQFAQDQAEEEIQPLIDQALGQLDTVYEGEITRLTALQRVNPAVRASEIDQLRQDQANLRGLLRAVEIKLDSVRMMIST